MADIFVMKKAIEEIDNRNEVALVTVLKASGSTPRGEGTMMLVYQNGDIYGTIGGGKLEQKVKNESLTALKKGKSLSVNIPIEKEDSDMVCGGEVDVFIDVCKVRPKLLVAGAGHVGTAVYNIASLLDFHITMFDDRERFLTEERFPLAEELIFGDIKENLAKYPMDENTYVVIVTRGHEYDQDSLEAVINKKPKYIGLMGSKKKVKAIMSNLKKKGIDEELLKKIYSPIGINLGGETPEEIAISIMAEVLIVKNEGSFIHMKSTI